MTPFRREPGPLLRHHAPRALTRDSYGFTGVHPHQQTCWIQTFPGRIRGPYARGVGLMVMIDLVSEKKSLGVISVTRATAESRCSCPRKATFSTYSQVTGGSHANPQILPGYYTSHQR